MILLKDVIYIGPQLLQQFYLNRNEDSPFSNLSNALISGIVSSGKYLVYITQESKRIYKSNILSFFEILSPNIADQNMQEITFSSFHTRVLSSEILSKDNSINVFIKPKLEFELWLKNIILQPYRYIFNILPIYKRKIIYSPFGFYSKDYIFTFGLNYKILYKY